MLKMPLSLLLFFLFARKAEDRYLFIYLLLYTTQLVNEHITLVEIDLRYAKCWHAVKYRAYNIGYNMPCQMKLNFWIEGLLIDLSDLFYAEINFMWAGHQTHHSSEDYNLTTALRQGVFQTYSSWVGITCCI